MLKRMCLLTYLTSEFNFIVRGFTALSIKVITESVLNELWRDKNASFQIKLLPISFPAGTIIATRFSLYPMLIVNKVITKNCFLTCSVKCNEIISLKFLINRDEKIENYHIINVHDPWERWDSNTNLVVFRESIHCQFIISFPLFYLLENCKQYSRASCT